MTVETSHESIRSQVESSKPVLHIKEIVGRSPVSDNTAQSTAISTNGSNSSTIEPNERKSAATQIVDAVLKENDGVTELWHTSEGSCHISIRYDEKRFEHRSLKSKETKQWLGGLYYAKTNNVANPSSIMAAITVLEGYAMNGPMYSTNIRVAEGDNAIYIDLGDDTWEAIRVTKEGWDIIKNPPVKFQRHRGLQPLPRPERGGSIDELRGILNIEDGNLWLLVKGWLIGTLSPRGPYAILAIAGEQGSAKTWLEKILRTTIDPNALPVRRPPGNTEDLMIAANNNWIVTFDNLSWIKAKLSDDLCNLATGGGLSKRELYSDSDETIFHVCRPMILNGIEDVVTRQDLLDRSIYITMPRIPDGRRRPEADLMKLFQEMHPKILGALLDAAVLGLQKKDTIKAEGLPRMADFAKWAVAALGEEGPEFLAAYKANRDHAIKDSLEGDPVVIGLRAYFEEKHGSKHGSWSGTATELLGLLNAITGYAYKRPPAGWPRAPNVLSGNLRRLAPALRKVGITVEFGRDEAQASRVISITREEVGT